MRTIKIFSHPNSEIHSLAPLPLTLVLFPPFVLFIAFSIVVRKGVFNTTASHATHLMAVKIIYR